MMSGEEQAATVLVLGNHVRELVRKEMAEAFNDHAFVAQHVLRSVMEHDLASSFIARLSYDTSFQQAVRNVIVEKLKRSY
jgi:predicted component of type VI protein secretion system